MWLAGSRQLDLVIKNAGASRRKKVTRAQPFCKRDHDSAVYGRLFIRTGFSAGNAMRPSVSSHNCHNILISLMCPDSNRFPCASLFVKDSGCRTVTLQPGNEFVVGNPFYW